MILEKSRRGMHPPDSSFRLQEGTEPHMNIDTIIMIAAWVMPIIMLLLFIPKERIREALLIFHGKQVITWVLGLSVVQLKLIEYPVRLFPYANKSNFTFEFFSYPAICSIFSINYPVGKSNLRKFMHYFYFCTVMTAFELLCEKYTDIIKYIHWTWYVTWITLFLTFFISRKYYLWFFKYNNFTEEDSLIDKLMK